MTRMQFAFVLALALMFQGCRISREIPKYAFADGYYTYKDISHKKSRIYVDNEGDSIFVYPVVGKFKENQVDTAKASLIYYPNKGNLAMPLSGSFFQSSFDVDFLTIPFKFRPATTELPAQFNTNLNGAVYLGYRKDYYDLGYKRSPLNEYRRRTTHYGYSLGIFNGLGGTAMNPWVTNDQINKEYDGVVWSKGIAGIIGIDNFTIGLALGWDSLLDKNKTVWIYEGKPWLGLAFGLNLN